MGIDFRRDILIVSPSLNYYEVPSRPSLHLYKRLHIADDGITYGSYNDKNLIDDIFIFSHCITHMPFMKKLLMKHYIWCSICNINMKLLTCISFLFIYYYACFSITQHNCGMNCHLRCSRTSNLQEKSILLPKRL